MQLRLNQFCAEDDELGHVLLAHSIGISKPRHQPQSATVAVCTVCSNCIVCIVWLFTLFALFAHSFTIFRQKKKSTSKKVVFGGFCLDLLAGHCAVQRLFPFLFFSSIFIFRCSYPPVYLLFSIILIKGGTARIVVSHYDAFYPH